MACPRIPAESSWKVVVPLRRRTARPLRGSETDCLRSSSRPTPSHPGFLPSRSRQPKPPPGGCRSARVVDLFPAIDIRNGRVVRLQQGETHRQTIYQDDPQGVAEDFIHQGAGWIHLVDLDRAFGVGSNLDIIRRVVERVSGRVRVQVGGGLRDLELVRGVLDIGAARVVVGTAAAIQPDFIPAAVDAFGPESLAVGIDAKNGCVAIRGWTELSSLRAHELAGQVVAQGIETL